MKRIVLLFVVFCSLAGGVNSQQIRTSPFEGRWVWDGKGEEPEMTELVYYGNVMLGAEEGDMEYEGMSFTYTARTITSSGYYDKEWQYRLSGNTLTITDEEGDSYSYRKTTLKDSPLEGIWKQTGGTDYDPDEDFLILFVSDIMALGGRSGYQGGRIVFKGKAIQFEGETIMEYRASGNSLTVISPDGDEEIILTKIY